MKKQNSSPRAAKIAVASTLGLALLVGGSTYALWSASEGLDSSATITTGDLQVASTAVQSWYDVTDAEAPVAIDLANYQLAPGNTLKLEQDINIIVVGDNISGNLVADLSVVGGANALADATFDLKLVNKDGVVVATTTQLGPEGLSAAVESLPQTDPAGETYTAEITVALPSDASDASKGESINLSVIDFRLDQGAPLAPVAE
jgi:alternate signal-mediated exported protein